MTFELDILDNNYQIIASLDGIGSPLRDLMSGFLTTENSGCNVLVKISEKRCVTGIGPETIGFETDEDLLVGVEHGLYRNALLASDTLVVHSAVLQFRKRIVLLVGSSGAGKTTLTLGLLNQGWKFLSDELAPLAPGNGFVRPFPRCPAASRKTMEMLSLRPESTKHVHLKDTYCILPNQLLLAEMKLHPIDHVVFLSRSETTNMTPVSGTEGMTRLLQAVGHEPDRSVAFQTAGTIAERARFYKLRNGELPKTIAELENIV